MNRDICEENRLLAFLNGELSDSDVDALTKRLDECPECRKKLEDLAASAGQWDDVRNHLSIVDARRLFASIPRRGDVLALITNALDFTIAELVRPGTGRTKIGMK